MRFCGAEGGASTATAAADDDRRGSVTGFKSLIKGFFSASFRGMPPPDDSTDASSTASASSAVVSRERSATTVPSSTRIGSLEGPVAFAPVRSPVHSSPPGIVAPVSLSSSALTGGVGGGSSSNNSSSAGGGGRANGPLPLFVRSERLKEQLCNDGDYVVLPGVRVWLLPVGTVSMCSSWRLSNGVMSVCKSEAEWEEDVKSGVSASASLLWGLPSCDWKWMSSGPLSFTAMEMADMPLRRALALSVLNNDPKRADADMPRDIWMADLIKQSQVAVLCRSVSLCGVVLIACCVIAVQVEAFKDWRRWNWNTIAWMMDGALCNQAHLTEALKSKFMKRIGKVFVLRSKKTGLAS